MVILLGKKQNPRKKHVQRGFLGVFVAI